MVREPRRDYRSLRNARLLFVIGGVFLLYSLPSYPEGPWYLGVAAGVGTVLLGVAEYLPPRWRAGAIALRLVFLLQLVVVMVLSVA